MRQVEEIGKELSNALHAVASAESRAAVAEVLFPFLFLFWFERILISLHFNNILFHIYPLHVCKFTYLVGSCIHSHVLFFSRPY